MQRDTELEIASEARQPPGTEWNTYLELADCRVAFGSSQYPYDAFE